MLGHRPLAAVAAGLLVGALGLTTVSSASASPGMVRAGDKPVHQAGPAKVTALSLHSSQPTGVIMPTPEVYLVFWGSQWSNDPANAAPALQAMFSTLYGSSDTWGTILDQYCEGMAIGTTNCGTSGTHVTHPTASILGGVWFDNARLAPAKATTAQLAAEAVTAAAHFQNTGQAVNLYDQYVIASPTLTHPDGFPKTGFCGWHSSTTNASGVKIAYTNLPYVPDLGPGACTTLSGARLIDGYESTETHEFAETVTDPFPSTGWLAGGEEVGDLCINLDAYLNTSGGTFDVQGLWSNSNSKCVTQGPTP